MSPREISLRQSIEALLPNPIPFDDEGMVRHGDWSHGGGLQCQNCEGYPHATCVPASALRALLDEAGL